MSKKKKLFELVKLLLIILALSLALRWLIPALTSDEFRGFVKELGPLGPLVVIFYTVLSHVFAPLAGTPGVLLSITTFGIIRTMFYVYLGSMISASLNFYISRRFGRKWVTRLVGKKAMNEVDQFVDASGEKVLILSRVFGFSLFEIISYAAGLTNIKFKKYFTITLVYTLIPNLLFTYFFRNIDTSSTLNLAVWIATLIITGLIFSFFFKKTLGKQKKEQF